jgi:uncharacterized Zn finger protein
MTRKAKYPRLHDGECFTINPRTEYLTFACCSCGHVHVFDFVDVQDNKLKIMISSNRRASARLRSLKYGDLHAGVGKWKMVRR